MGAGRLEDLVEPDAEPRPAVRPDLERVRAERHLPAVRGGRIGRRTRTTSSRASASPISSTTGRCARRRRAVLQRRPEHERAVADEPADDRRDSGQQRWPRRISRPTRSTGRCRPTPRRCSGSATSTTRPGACCAICQEQAPIPDLRARHAQPGRARSASPTSSATTWRSRSTTSTPRSRDEKVGVPGQRQHHVQSRHRHPLSVFGRRASRRFPLYGVVGMIPHIGQSDYHGLQTSFTKRMSQPLAGVAHLYAGRPLGPGSAAAQRLHPGAVPGRAGSRRRTLAGGNRSAASAGVQRHLAGGARLPGERHLLLRLRPAHAGRLRLRRAWLRRSPASTACGWMTPSDRMVRSFRAKASSGSRSTASRCGSSSASRSAAAGRSLASSKCSTCSTGRTTASTTPPRPARHTGSQYRAQNLSYAPRTVQLGFRLTF